MDDTVVRREHALAEVLVATDHGGQSEINEIKTSTFLGTTVHVLVIEFLQEVWHAHVPVAFR